MQFHFQLEPINAVPAWGDENPNLHWYGLTLGWFWIEVMGTELFRYSEAIHQHWSAEEPPFVPALPHDDYQIARYWEDLLEILPAVLTPIPDALSERVANEESWNDFLNRACIWREQQDTDEAWDMYGKAVEWWRQRGYFAFHLRYPPDLWIWRTKDMVHIRWDCRKMLENGLPAWAATVGEEIVTVSAFVEAVTSFDNRLIQEMGERVVAARSHWPRPEVAIDLDALEREQNDRSGWLANALHKHSEDTDWETVLSALTKIEKEMGV